jgi:hypothetical protein
MCQILLPEPYRRVHKSTPMCSLSQIPAHKYFILCLNISFANFPGGEIWQSRHSFHSTAVTANSKAFKLHHPSHKASDGRHYLLTSQRSELSAFQFITIIHNFFKGCPLGCTKYRRRITVLRNV